MALKYFINAYKGNASDAISINSEYVVAVFEHLIEAPTEGKKKKPVNQKVTNIYMTTGLVYSVENDYLEVVARLNEKD
jgi:hypothetical protein